MYYYYFPQIAKLRKDNYFTQEYVAHELQLNRSLYARYEKGQRKVPIEVLITIADFYDIPFHLILDSKIKMGEIPA